MQKQYEQKELEERQQIFDLALNLLDNSKKPDSDKLQVIKEIGKVTSIDLMAVEGQIKKLQDLQKQIKQLQKRFATIDESIEYESLTNEVRRLMFMSAEVEEKIDECKLISDMLRNHNTLLVQKVIDYLVTNK